MYQPITPVMPFVPMLTTDLFFSYGVPGRFCQSSITTSIFPSAIAWKAGWPSVMLSTLTLHFSLFSRTFLST